MTNDMFFDIDCLSAFLWINDTLYGGNIVLPNQVYLELSNPHVPHLKTRADALISKNAASVKSIDVGTDEYRLYRNLINRKLPTNSFSDYLKIKWKENCCNQ